MYYKQQGSLNANYSRKQAEESLRGSCKAPDSAQVPTQPYLNLFHIM